MGRHRLIATVLLPAIVGIAFLTLRRRFVYPTGGFPCPNVAKQLALGIHNYHSYYGQLPPHAVHDADGTAKHCWRTHLLPVLAAIDPLYRWDEPWNGPFNDRLARGQSVHVDAPPPGESIKTIGPYDGPIDYAFFFRCPQTPNETDHFANFYAVVGDKTPWPPHGSRSFDEISDGIANTILLVESNTINAYWSEPRDLQIDNMDFVVNGSDRAGISSVHDRGPIVVFCDGAVFRLNPEIAPSQVRALLTATGGEDIQRDKLVADDWLRSP